MTEEITTATPSITSAGVLLRQYREKQGCKLDVLAQALRVSSAKLEALEADRLDELPDTMFARALTLAVCRHLKADAAPVLALLPGHDVSRLAAKNERGLDFPLDRPSFLPQSSLFFAARVLTPMQWMALIVLMVALVMGLWPEIRALWVFKEEPVAAVVVAPVDATAVALPSTAADASTVENGAGNMVVTTVHSAAVTAQAASASGASDAK